MCRRTTQSWAYRLARGNPPTASLPATGIVGGMVGTGAWVVARLAAHGAKPLSDQLPRLGPDQGHQIRIEIIVSSDLIEIRYPVGGHRVLTIANSFCCGVMSSFRIGTCLCSFSLRILALLSSNLRTPHCESGCA